MNSPLAFPASLEEEYYFIRCEKCAQRSSAFFAVQRTTGQQVLVKLARSPEDGRTFQNEYDLLKRLERLRAPAAALFPRAVECRELPEGFALIREYIAIHAEKKHAVILAAGWVFCIGVLLYLIYCT